MKSAVEQPHIVRHRSYNHHLGHNLRLVGLGLFLLLFFLTPILYTRAGNRARVYAATNSELNFQARLLNSQGGIVADGNSYSVQFKLYNVASGGTTEWTETQSGLTVKSGYLSVHLGMVTPFPSTIDWSVEQWLTMNVNSDGEMSPRLKLTSVPYAFRAGQADTLTNGSSSLTANDLAQLAPSSVQVINSALAALRLNQTGGGALFQLQHNGSDVFTVASNGDLNSSGSGTFSGGSLTLGGAAQAGSLVFNDGAGKKVTIQSATLGANRTLTAPNESGTICVQNSANCGFVLSGGAAGAFVNNGNSFGVAAVLGTNDNFSLTFRTNNTNQVTLDTSGNFNLLNGGLQVGGTSVLTSGRALQNLTGLTVVSGGESITGGSTISGGAISLNDNSNFATNINTSGSIGTVTIGGGSAPLVIDSTAFDVTSGGNISTPGTYNTNTFTSTALTFAGGASTISTSTVNAGLTLQSNGTGVVALDSGTTGAINIGTGANAKTITLGNGTGATSLVLNSGTGAINIGTNAIAHTITIGNGTGATSLVLNSGTGAINIGTNAIAHTLTLGNSTGATSLVLNAGTGAINIGTNAIAHTTTIGNVTGASSVVVDCGTGACSFGASATIHTTTLGSNTGAAITTIQAGTGGLTVGNGGIANTLQIGNTSGAVTQTINVGNNATASSQTNLTIGSTIGASTTTLQAGSGGLVINASTLKRTASGTTTLDLIDGANTTLALTNSGTGVANLTADGSITAATGLTVSAGGAAITGNSTIAGTLSSLTGLTSAGTITFSGLGAGLVQSSSGGVLSSGTVDRNSSTFLSNTLTVTNGGTGAGTFTSNGVIYGNGTSALGITAAGTTGQCLVATTSAAPTWGSCAGTGSGTTLQAAYGNGNSITTSDGRNIAFTLADTTTDSNFLVNIATGSTSKFAIQSNGTDVLHVTSSGIVIDSGGLTISAGGANITGNSTIAGTLGSLTGLTSSGTITFSGLGAGLVQSSSGGALSSGAADRNSATFFNTTLTVANGGIGTNTLTSNGLLYGNGTGAIQATSAGTGGQVLLANGSGVPTFTSLSGDITVNSTGVTTVGADAVALGTDTTGSYVANLGTLTGLSTTGNSGEGSTPTLSVLYGATANTAVQGNTTLTCASGTGNLNGGGTAITLGTGGTCAALDTINNPTFSGLLTASKTGATAFAVTGAPTSSATSSLIQIGSAIASGNTATNGGTYIGLNAPASGNPGTAADFLNFQVNGTYKLKVDTTGLIDTAGGLAVGGSTVLTNGRAAQNLTGVSSSGTITFSGLSTGLVQSSSGTLSAGAVDRNSATFFNTALTVANGGTGAGTFTANGVMFGNGTSALGVTAAGTTGQCLVATTGSAPAWGSCAGAGSGVTLQAAYDNGNGITTSDGRNIAFTLADTTTDGNLLINIASGSTGKFAVQNNGSDILQVTIAGGVAITGNTSVASGTFTSSGGAINLNAGSNFATNINTGGSTGTITLGGGSAPLVIDSTHFDVSSAGALSGITSIGLSSSISGGTTYTGSGNINTTGGTLQTNSTDRVDNSGNLVNIGNITGTGAVTLSSTGGANALTLTSGSGTIALGSSIVQRSGSGLTLDVANAGTSTLTVTNSDASNVANLSVEGGITAGTNSAFSVNVNGDITGVSQLLDGSSTANGGSFGSSTSLTLTSAANFDVGNYVQVTSANCGGAGVNPCYAKITAKATNTLTITPALTWANGSNVKEYHIPEIGGVDTSQALANRYGRGYFIAGVATGNGTTFYNEDSIVTSLANYDLLSGVTGTLSVGVGANQITLGGSSTTTTFAGTVNFTGTVSGIGPSSGTSGYLQRSGTTISPATAGDNFTTSGNISTSGSGTITSASTLTVQGGGASITGGLTLATGALNLTSGGITNTGSIAGATTIAASGAITAAASGNTINGLIINAGALSGISTINASGLITSVGHNAGTGLIQNTGGLTSTGSISLNASASTNTTNIGTGTTSGQVTIGGGSAPLVIDSTAFDVSSAGALSGITSIGLSGAITGATSGNTINGLIINSGALSGISTITASGNINSSGGGIQTGGVTRIDNTGNLTNIAGISNSSAFTISSGGGGGLTIDSGSNKLIIAASDTTLQRTAAGAYTVDLADTGTTTLALTNSGSGTADFNIAEGALQTAGTSRLTNGGALQNISGYTQSSGNFAISGAGTFGTGTGAISLNGATTVTGTNAFTVSGGLASLGAGLSVTGDANISLHSYIPGMTFGTTTAQGYFTGSSTTKLGGLQSLDYLSNTYTFFGNNKYFDGTNWQDNGLGRTGASFQIQNDNFTFYSFDTAANFTARFSVASGGNVAIGLSGAPGALLSVGGTTGNFQVTSSGAVTSVGETSSGALASFNNNSNFGTNINTGTSTGTITLGGGSAPLVINSTNFDVSSAGALSGITTISASGDINTSGGGLQTAGVTRITNSGFLSNIAGITGSGAFTLSSGGSGGLTLDSANGKLIIAGSDTILERTAAGTYTIDLIDGSTTTLALTNSGAGTADFNIAEGGLGTAGTIRLTNAGALQNLTTINASGLITSVGHNAGTGLIQNTGGLTSTGSISLNASASANTTSVGTGTTSGQITIGGGSAPLVIDSTNFDVSSAGALSGITTVAASGLVTLSANTSALSLTGAPVNTATTSLLRLGNALVGGNTTTNGGTYIGVNLPANGSNGSVADVVNFQKNGSLLVRIDSSGNINTTGVYQQNGTNGITVAACTAGQYIGNGVAVAGGIITAGSCRNDAQGLSDERLKKDITPVSSVLDKLKEVNVVTYNFRRDDFPEMNLDKGLQYGVIAQQLAQVFPDLVTQRDDGYYQVNFQGLNFYNLKAVTELAAKVDSISTGGASTDNGVSTGGTMRLDKDGKLVNITGLDLISGGASVSGGINNNNSGLTNTGTIQGATSIDAQKLSLNATGPDNMLELKKDNKGVFTVFNNGALQLQLDAGSILAIKDASGKNIFNIDSLTGRITLGSGDDSKTVLFVLDNRTLPDDPPGTNGASYYNTVMQRFRCYEDSKWQDCLPAGDLTDPIASDQVSWQQPSSDQEFPGTPRTVADLTRAHEFRLRIRLTSPGASNAVCRLQYASGDAGPWNDIAAETGHELAINQAGTLKTDWVKLTDDARKQDTIIRVMCKNGDTLQRPVFYGVSVQLR